MKSLLKLIASVLLLSLLSCISDDDSSDPVSSELGNWKLLDFNGEAQYTYNTHVSTITSQAIEITNSHLNFNETNQTVDISNNYIITETTITSGIPNTDINTDTVNVEQFNIPYSITDTILSVILPDTTANFIIKERTEQSLKLQLKLLNPELDYGFYNLEYIRP